MVAVLVDYLGAVKGEDFLAWEPSQVRRKPNKMFLEAVHHLVLQVPTPVSVYL